MRGGCVLLVLLGAVAFPPAAGACSCAPVEPREAMGQADAAFAGKLVEVVPRGRSRVALRYRVRRVIKPGPGIRRGRLVTVLSPRGGAACGLPARTGRSYGLMLSRDRGFWSGGLCGLLRGYRRSGGCAS